MAVFFQFLISPLIYGVEKQNIFSFLGHIFLFVGLCYTWDNFEMQRSGKKIEPEPKLCKIVKLFTSVNSV